MTLFQELILKSELTEEEILEMTRDDFQELIRHPKQELDIYARTKLLREWKKNRHIVPEYASSFPPAATLVTPTRTTSMPRTTIEILDSSGDEDDRKPAAVMVKRLPTAKEEQGTTCPEHVKSNHHMKGEKNDKHPNTTELNRPGRHHVENVSSSPMDPNGSGNQTTRHIISSVAARLPESIASNVDSLKAKRRKEVAVAARSKNAKRRLSDDHSTNVQDDSSPRCQVSNLVQGSYVKYGADASEDANESDDEGSPSSSLSSPPTLTLGVKEEATRKNMKEKRENVYRKYANRYLLHRHDGLGIPRLGGGHQDTYPRPSEWHKNIWDKDHKLRREYPIPRHLSDLEDGEKPQTMDDFQYTAYNMLWNPKAPKYAGQPFAAVSGVPEHFLINGLAFPVFVSRRRTENKSQGANLGWEYVGNYKVSPEKETNTFWESADNFATISKSLIKTKVFKSSQSAGGYGRRELEYWRLKLIRELENDHSPAAPSYMKQKREPTEEEIRAKRPPIAARARALNFSPTMSDKALVDLLVNLDEYYKLIAIQFVEYDERIYEYCKGGKTNRDRLGRSNKKQPAKAGDWYDFAEQHMMMT